LIRFSVDAGGEQNYAEAMTVTAEYAAKHFDELLAAMDGGSSIEILRPDKPTLRVTAEVFEPEPRQAGKRILGAGKALKYLPSEEELERIDREWKREIEEKRIG
jgi:antitoxin (DNA-binding transcriptional repressor) of toxin-antitoxin stability system